MNTKKQPLKALYCLILIFTTLSSMPTDEPTISIPSAEPHPLSSIFTSIKEKFHNSPLFAGYHSSAEQKTEALQKLEKLLLQKEELLEKSIDLILLSPDEEQELFRQIAAIDEKINEQKITIGQKWSVIRKAIVAALTAAGTALLIALGIKNMLNNQPSTTPIIPVQPTEDRSRIHQFLTEIEQTDITNDVSKPRILKSCEDMLTLTHTLEKMPYDDAVENALEEKNKALKKIIGKTALDVRTAAYYPMLFRIHQEQIERAMELYRSTTPEERKQKKINVLKEIYTQLTENTYYTSDTRVALVGIIYDLFDLLKNDPHNQEILTLTDQALRQLTPLLKKNGIFGSNALNGVYQDISEKLNTLNPQEIIGTIKEDSGGYRQEGIYYSYQPRR